MEDNVYYLNIENDMHFEDKQENVQMRAIRMYSFLRYIPWISWVLLTSVIVFCVFGSMYRIQAVSEWSVFTKTMVSVLLIMIMTALMVHIYRILDSCRTTSLKKNAAIKECIEQVNGIQKNISKKESCITVDWNGKVHGVYISDGAPSHWEIQVNTNHTYLTFSEDHHKNTVTVRFENYGDPYQDMSVHLLCPYSLYGRYQKGEGLRFVEGKLIK